MSYEFTKQKIRAERKSLMRGIAITAAATALGFSLGMAISDIDTIRGMLRAATAGVVAGLIGFALAALSERRQ